MRKVSSDIVLLDVNVLLALAWPNHQCHGSAIRRLERGSEAWATCALTEIGFIRLSSNPAVVGVPTSPWEAARLLARMLEDPRHIYLSSLPSPASLPVMKHLEGILGYRQVTDAYLAALARESRAVLLTFDRRIAEQHGATAAIEVLG